ncbi:amino acid-binding protein [candidate division KSB1 bacterium]|nr:amino acid-binding protein [candidate division KSB1 bacterium]
MKIQQLSIFLENKPGNLGAICKVLKDANLNILNMSLADTQQFGILRLIIHDFEKAKNLLQQAGYIVNLKSVVAIEIDDKPGGIFQVLETLEKEQINIDYLYPFALRRYIDRAVLIFRFSEPEKAIEILKRKAFTVLQAEKIFEMREKMNNG